MAAAFATMREGNAKAAAKEEGGGVCRQTRADNWSHTRHSRYPGRKAHREPGTPAASSGEGRSRRDSIVRVLSKE